MSVGNCPECGRLYQKNPQRMCASCYQKEQENEALVYEFVRDHPKSSMSEIVEGTGVKEKTVTRMIKSGRFFDESAMISYPCQQCGAPIYSGRLCAKCNEGLIKQVQASEKKRKAAEQEEAMKKQGSGMYSKDMMR